MTEQAAQTVERWLERLRNGETVHSGRSRTMLVILLLVSAALVGAVLWTWSGRSAAINIGLALVLPFLWLNYAFAEIRFGEDCLEFRDWILQPRRRRVDLAFVAAVAWRPAGKRSDSPDLFLCYSPSGLGDDLKWIPLSTWLWPNGLREAVQQEMIRRCGFTESSSAGPESIMWRRPVDTRQLP